MSRLHRIADVDRIFFVTTNLHPRARQLEPVERDILLDWLGKVRDRHKFLLVGYVVMPEHAHALLSTTFVSLSKIIHGWKWNSARVIQRRRNASGPLWQPRYFDSICRRVRDVSKKLEYIHDNPVEAAFVQRPEEWKWSSAAFYAKTGISPLIPDDLAAGDPDELLWPAPWRRN